MWYLTHHSTGAIFYIKQATTTIGRRGTDLEIVNDDSISRNHAILNLSPSGLTVQDVGSKYGTFLISGEELKQIDGEAMKVTNGTHLRFGKLESDYTVQKVTFKTMTSMLSQSQKEKLGRILNVLNIEVIDSYDETCTHLTMLPTTEVSHKLLQALSSCTPIVTIKFWMAFQESVAKNIPLPKCLDYTPRIKEEAYITPDSVSLFTNPERRRLFARKSFVFVSKTQLAAFEGIITSAGGRAGIPKQLGLSSKDMTAKNVIVVQPKDTVTQSQNESVVTKVRAQLDAKNLRMIIDTEIGLALLHCSIERWCNPEFDVSSVFTSTQSASLKITKSKVLAPESEHIEKPTTSKRSTRNKPVTIDLDSEEEACASNKENVPNHAATEDISLAPTQEDEPMTEGRDTAPTIQTDFSSMPDQDESSADSSHVPARRSTRRPQVSNESSFQSAVSALDTQSSVASSLFDFTDSSTQNRPQRKRKKTESEDVIEMQPSTSAGPSKQVKDQPATKKSKKSRVEHVSLEEPSQSQPTRSTRKRPASDAEDDGGLFTFPKTSSKKLKQTDDGNQSQGSRGITTLSKPRGSSPVLSRKSTDGYLDDLVEGAWLSKKMLSMHLEAADGINSEFLITPIKIESLKREVTSDSEDIKPETFFNVLEQTLTASTTSSLVSKRKQFVKKLNFKPQSKIVSTQAVKVEDTFIPLDEF